FSATSLLLLFALLLGHSIVELEASHHFYQNLPNVETSSTNQPYRTAYHFQPPKWMNAPMIYKGIYHLFYQYSPKGPVWGTIVWAHYTSTDLVNWTPQDVAMYPSQLTDINGVWSGSATILPNGTPMILYTGANPQMAQTQNLAMAKNPSDPYLREWVKSPKNPLMAPTATNQVNSSSFRDPSTAWLGPDKTWRVVIGSKRNSRGLALLYRSKDFVHWIEAKHPLHSAKDTGMWECPFFPVSIQSPKGVDTSIFGTNVKHVLKVSLDDIKRDYYTIGTYNIDKEFVSSDDAWLRYDYDKFYAPKTFFDSAKNKRILWDWINESSSVIDDKKNEWCGVQVI
ncbi:LOW QUALITY PROTEIN: Glyco_hydro_32N domain-containing protein, partial [Cephalotus follicularis]